MGNVSRRHTVGQEFLSRLDLAVGHLALPPADTAEFSGDFESRTRTPNGQLALHFCQAGHHMKEEATRWCAGIDGVSQAMEMLASFVKVCHQVD